ncbi:MAG: hypothetical protein ACT4QA_00235 [Panacagrimonas sp.]
MSNPIFRKSLACLLSAVAAVLLPASLLAAGPIKPLSGARKASPASATFVNSSNPPAVASDALGNTVVAMLVTVNTAERIVIQGYNNLGDPLREGFVLVDTASNTIIEAPVIAMDATGRFVLAWESTVAGSGDTDIVARRFGRDLRPLDPAEFLVNRANTVNDQQYPAVAMGPDGEFVVSWTSQPADGSGFNEIRARRFNFFLPPENSADEIVAVGNEDSFLGESAVAMSARGEWVVMWDDDRDRFEEVVGIRGRAYDGGGAKGPAFPVSGSPGVTGTPRLAINADGDYVVCWTQQDDVLVSKTRVFARRFRFPAVPIDSNGFLIRGDDDPGSFESQVSVDLSGRFVIVYRGTQGNGVGARPFARVFRPNGRPLGREFVLAQQPAFGDQSKFRVAADADGDFSIAYYQRSTDGFGNQIEGASGYFARRFRGPEPIDLSVRIKGPREPLAGLPANFKVIATNLHPVSPATGPVDPHSAIGAALKPSLFITLPQGFSVVRRIDFQPGSAGRCLTVDAGMRCDFGRSLAAGETATVRFSAIPLSPGRYETTATVSTDSLDPDEGKIGSNNEAVEVTRAVPP